MNNISVFDWFRGQALANPNLCTGTVPDYQITVWFGRDRTCITKAEIVAKQATEYAKEMVK